jgi:hypothetical protein
VGRATEILAEFGTQLGRSLLALLLQFGVPVVALYLALVVPPLFGCLSYSDRPGPGCYGLTSRVGLAEAAQYATLMLDYAFFAARFLWPSAFLCTFVALVTEVAATDAVGARDSPRRVGVLRHRLPHGRGRVVLRPKRYSGVGRCRGWRSCRSLCPPQTDCARPEPYPERSGR